MKSQDDDTDDIGGWDIPPKLIATVNITVAMVLVFGLAIVGFVLVH